MFLSSLGSASTSRDTASVVSKRKEGEEGRGGDKDKNL